MRSTPRVVTTAALCSALAAGLCWISASRSSAASPKTSSAAKPVEDNMHEFMEYVFQPNYRQLKSHMAEQPSDGRAWSAIKAEALTLAEGGNLLLFRGPEQDRAAWTQHSVEVREHGGKLYRAAQSKDFAAARKHYEAMLKDCNACHQQFAGGEYQLKP